jgi:hypothetical protein
MVLYVVTVAGVCELKSMGSEMRSEYHRNAAPKAAGERRTALTAEATYVGIPAE